MLEIPELLWARRPECGLHDKLVGLNAKQPTGIGIPIAIDMAVVVRKVVSKSVDFQASYENCRSLCR